MRKNKINVFGNHNLTLATHIVVKTAVIVTQKAHEIILAPCAHCILLCLPSILLMERLLINEFP